MIITHQTSSKPWEVHYDDLYRLTQEQVTDSVIGNRTTAYTYDAVGNRLSKDEGGTMTAYVYDNNDQLMTETESGNTTSYSYDANGNTLTKSDVSGSISYVYDTENRLIQATEGTEITAYTYDIDNIRQSKTDSTGTVQYLVDPNQAYAQVLEELDENDQHIVSYLYGDDLISQSRNNDEHYYHYDGLGSTRSLTDSAGIETDTYHYDAFGNLENQTGITENNYLYTGEQFDANLGFYYLRARYMNPSIGRFVSMDTFAGINSDPVTLHKYLYANVNPVNFTDPSGNATLVGLSIGFNVQTTLTSILIVTGLYATIQTGRINQ